MCWYCIGKQIVRLCYTLMQPMHICRFQVPHWSGTVHERDYGVHLIQEQKCMCQSPTKAELMVLMDNLGFAELFQELIKFPTMKKHKPPNNIPKLNAAVITLVMKEGGCREQSI
jgi:hypothetical protein